MCRLASSCPIYVVVADAHLKQDSSWLAQQGSGRTPSSLREDMHPTAALHRLCFQPRDCKLLPSSPFYVYAGPAFRMTRDGHEPRGDAGCTRTLLATWPLPALVLLAHSS